MAMGMVMMVYMKVVMVKILMMRLGCKFVCEPAPGSVPARQTKCATYESRIRDRPDRAERPDPEELGEEV